jgi:hypothetical protein
MKTKVSDIKMGDLIRIENKILVVTDVHKQETYTIEAIAIYKHAHSANYYMLANLEGDEIYDLVNKDNLFAAP